MVDKDFGTKENPHEYMWCWEYDNEGNMEYRKKVPDHAVAGDTDSIYLSIPNNLSDLSIDDICEVADTIAEEVNKTFPEFLMNAFNCPEERSGAITTGREVVSDKSLFLTKKRYIMNIVDNEGKRTNELKIMGVEIKKSDTSPKLKEILMNIVNHVLEGITREELEEKINKMKKDFYESDPLEIATPKGCKVLRKYQDMYEMTGSKKGFPSNVRAAMFYNEIKGHKDPEIVSGDKILLLYIDHPRSKNIAFPAGVQKLPDFMKDISIDYDREWENIQKKVTNYLESLGWDRKSRKKEMLKDNFGL